MRKPGDYLVRAGFILIVALLALMGWLINEVRLTPRQAQATALDAVENKEKALVPVRRFFAQGVQAARDFFINNHQNAADVFAQDLRKSKAGLAGGIAELRRAGTDPALLNQFQNDAAEYWLVLDHARTFTPQEKADNAIDYLREDIYLARNTAQDSLKEITDSVTRDRTTLMTVYNDRRDHLITWFYVCLGTCAALGLVLAWVSLSYRSTLRRESLGRFDEIARARDELEHLSGKLLKVQEEERRRLSRELHDGIGQTLTALRMEIHQAHSNPGSGSSVSERLVRARMLAEEAVHTVKDISLLLRPPVLDDLGLEPAIAWQADQFSRRTGIVCRFHSSGLQEVLPDDVKTCVFRVIQEALNNCQKHASPTKVQILVEQKPETLFVQVEDDGAGFVPNERNVRHSGLGILGMRERASMLGGSVTIESSPGKGTRVVLSLPLAKMTASTGRRMEQPVSVPAIGPPADREI